VYSTHYFALFILPSTSSTANNDAAKQEEVNCIVSSSSLQGKLLNRIIAMATFDAKISPPTGKASAAKAKAVTPHDETLDKRMTVERGVVDELLLVCGVIGTTTDGDELVPVTDCLNWLQDLQRALRRDDDTFRPISLLLAKWKVVQQKLLPLVMTCRYDTPMVLTIVKILVILTKPLGEATKKAGRFAIDTKKYSEE
jgi:timeless